MNRAWPCKVLGSGPPTSGSGGSGFRTHSNGFRSTKHMCSKSGPPNQRGQQQAFAMSLETTLEAYFTKSIYGLVLESQLPHKIFTLLFTNASEGIVLTVLWGR